MICERCGKEFTEDWRKDKYLKRTQPIPRFCSAACAHSRKHSEEAKLKVSKTLQKLWAQGEFKAIHSKNRNAGFTDEDRIKARQKQQLLKEERIKELLASNDFEHLPGKIRRQYLLEEAQHSCQSCGNSTWLGKKIWLEIHHINDNNADNKKSNLIVVCPNCHAALDEHYRFKGRKHT